VPEPPEELEGELLEEWHRYWGSEIAQLVDAAADRRGITRLFLLYEERDRLYEEASDENLVKGSTGQWVLNPLFKRVEAIDKEIRLLEDRYGKSPKARLQLGGSFADTMKSLHELNQATRKAAKKRKKDPRLRAI
jgi:hypothetical protein